MMAIVMDLHRARIDVRLERVVGIGKRFKFEWASRGLRMDVARKRDNRGGAGQEFAAGGGGADGPGNPPKDRAGPLPNTSLPPFLPPPTTNPPPPPPTQPTAP